jgi:hypothetical protein
MQNEARSTTPAMFHEPVALAAIRATHIVLGGNTCRGARPCQQQQWYRTAKKEKTTPTSGTFGRSIRPLRPHRPVSTPSSVADPVTHFAFQEREIEIIRETYNDVIITTSSDYRMLPTSISFFFSKRVQGFLTDRYDMELQVRMARVQKPVSACNPFRRFVLPRCS